MNNKLYLGQESLESVKGWIEHSLLSGSSVASIARAMIGTKKAEIIITKELEMYMDKIQTDRALVKLLTEYINDSFKHAMKRGCTTNVIKEIVQNNNQDMDIDEYCDFLTDLLNDGAYQRVNSYITDIMVSYEPYMKEQFPHDFENMTMNEHEVALIKFTKKHLVACADKKHE